MGPRKSNKTVLILSVALIVVVAIAGGAFWWRSSTAAANAKAQCFVNQRAIEEMAAAYVQADPKHALADVEGPVNGSNPLVSSVIDGDAEFLPVSPRCPNRPGEFYILTEGRTDCPVHGTYE